VAEQLDTTLRTAMAQSYADALASGSMKLFSGSLPANCAASDPATTLATGSLPATAATASSGVATKAGTWSFTGAVAAGGGTVATVYRLYRSGGGCAAQGTVGPSYTADWAASTAYTAGDRRKNGANVYLCATSGTSASSGGPTGTGSGISDGTATWNYLGVAGDMGIDNTSISSGQAGAVSTWTRTMPGA
jgi:hypothetical protein